MHLLDKRTVALQALHLVRQAVGMAISHGLLKVVLWFSQNETLADRLDLAISELERFELMAQFDPMETAETLRRIKAVLDMAKRTGALQETLWASPRELLFDHIDAVIKQLTLPATEVV